MVELDARALGIVEACLDLDEAEREAFIARECGDSDRLTARVRRILAMEEAGDALLSTRIIERRHDEAEQIPERVGKFRITGLIGRGGMGMVVRGQRDDGIYSQDVAIKLIRAGLRGESDRERFANERRLLARLSHPSIAHIIDGGEEAGRPWLAMELVEGEVVTADLRARAAGIDETLDVFERIADAVSHAHRQLVIHGDIKPSNILRTPEGAVKLLDFGIGRFAEQLDASGGPYPLTAAFAAPERHQGEPPTVAGDVFSLGVLLHDMLADALPQTGKAMSEVATGARLSRGRLKGDLDAIVARAMAGDPARRYPDVAALRQDIGRHRRLEPVAARPAAFGYRAGRFLRRNRLPVAVGTALALILAGTALVSTLLYFEAQRQRMAAVARFEQLRSLARFQLFDLYDRLAETPGTTAARARLAAEAQHYLDSLAAIPGASADLRLDVARGLDRLAAVQGVPRTPNLGRPDAARRNLARAGSILEGLAAAAPGAPQIEAERTRNLVLRAQMAIWRDFRTDEARRLLSATVAPTGGGDAARELEALRRSARLDLLGWEERYSELRAAGEADLRWLDLWPRPRTIMWHVARAEALHARGDAAYYLQDREGALRDYLASDRLLASAAARWPRRSAILARQMISGYDIASARTDMGRLQGLPEFGEALLRRGELLLQLEADDEALRRRQTVNRELVAQILERVGRHDAAVVQQKLVVAERERLAAQQPGEPRARRDLAFSRSVLGTLNWHAGRRDEACAAWRAAASGLAPLARAGRLSAFDREHSLAYLIASLAICDGRRPASAYRSPD
jgi:hypothetical protein